MAADADLLLDVTRALSAGRSHQATRALARFAGFVPRARTTRRYGPLDATRVFARDGFVDRYSGERLVFPGALRLISTLLPAALPFHPNWKTDRTHPAYWRLSATLDHVVPIARGGADDDSNWVTTSMLRNSAKLHWTLEELGWRLHPPGALADWDGLSGWFLDSLRIHPELSKHTALRSWRRAASLALGASR